MAKRDVISGIPQRGTYLDKSLDCRVIFIHSSVRTQRLNGDGRVGKNAFWGVLLVLLKSGYRPAVLSAVSGYLVCLHCKKYP